MIDIPPPPENPHELESWLASFTNWEKQLPLGKEKRELGPTRCRLLLDRAQLDTRGTRVIQIAGSKGKGSTVLWLETLLSERGLSVGATTSPHLHSLEERIRIQQQPIPFQRLLKALKTLYPALLAGQSLGDPTPTFFDLWTVLFIQLALEEKCEVILLEVGLGGPLDSTTAIPHDVGVLTTVDLEHRDLLGDTIEEIAAEKSKISRSGFPFVISHGQHQKIALETAKERRALPILAKLDSRIPDSVPTHQKINASAALAALEVGDIYQAWSKEEVQQAWDLLELPGRLEIIPGDPPLLLDGAHTPASMAAFSEAFQKHRKSGDKGASAKGAIVLGMLSDKEPLLTLQHLLDLEPFPDICTLTVPTKRGLSAEELAEVLKSMLNNQIAHHSIHIAKDPESAQEWLIKKAAIGEPIAATGSMYLAGLVRNSWLDRNQA
ncbi:MAG: hypothetical protein GWP41_00310 [Planctomycetia bacterium]|nr:hypothetical protein [Planctomycetia bacterium]